MPFGVSQDRLLRGTRHRLCLPLGGRQVEDFHDAFPNRFHLELLSPGRSHGA